jgi:hypothetical protein
VFLRGRVNIQDSKPRHITLKSVTPSNRTHSDATVVQARSRPRRSRSNQPPSPAVRPRSRSSSVTKATITHYRRSLIETRKKSRPHIQKETPPTKPSTRAPVPKTRSFTNSYRLAVTNKPTVSRLPPLEIVPVSSAEIETTGSSSSSSTVPLRPRYIAHPQRTPHTRKIYRQAL